MQKISLQKRSFFNSIGLDIKNLPDELKIKTNSVQEKLPKEDIVFFKNENMATIEKKHFRLKNLVGTVSNKYNGKTWTEILINNVNSDDTIKKYFKNPNYYFKELKKIDTVSLKDNNNLELYEDNGKFFIKNGISTLALMMVKYSLEMSRAKTKEERLMINKQYIFAANVKSVPKDRDAIYLINMLLSIYGEKLQVEKNNNDDEYSYTIKYNNKSIKINTKEELENFIKNSYLPKEYKSQERLKNKILNLVKIGISYKENEDNEEAFLVMGRIFPNYEIFIKYYTKIQKYNLETTLLDALDLENITYEVILKRMIKLVKQEEKNNKEKKSKAAKITKEKNDNNVATKTKSTKIDKEKKSSKSDETAKIKDKKELETKQSELEKIKQDINAQLKYISENIELIYYKLKAEEAKFMDLADSTNIVLNIDKINDNNITLNINEIKECKVKINKKIENGTEISKLKNLDELLKDFKELVNDKNIITKYIDEMTFIFNNCFNKAVEKMITDSKLRKLDIQKEEIEKEKCSFFSKLLGKAKLKQAKLDNINLKKQLILSESQFNNKSYNYLEDGLSDIYVYMKEETEESCISDIRLFLKNVESNSKLKSRVDKTKLNNLVKEKENLKRNLPQLVLSREKRKLFSKAQINLVEEKNNELKRVIQITRANSLKLQNTGMIPILGNIQMTKSVNKFCNNLNEIAQALKEEC